jgi:hypothetical protein
VLQHSEAFQPQKRLYGSGDVELHFANLSRPSLNFWEVGWCFKTITHSNQQAVPITRTLHKFIYYKSHNDGITAVLPHTGDKHEVKRLF